MDLGGTSLAEALDRAGPDGDVFVVDNSPDRLDELRHECKAPNVFYLLGDADVLPLLDHSVDAVLDGSGGGGDLARVLRAT